MTAEFENFYNFVIQITAVKLTVFSLPNQTHQVVIEALLFTSICGFCVVSTNVTVIKFFPTISNSHFLITSNKD